MTDAGAQPPYEPIPTPGSATPPPTYQGPVAYAAPGGVVPDRVSGPYYSPGLVVLLMIVTFGIWGFFWTYRTSEDLKKYNGSGLGGILGLILYLFVSVVLMFTIPYEIKTMYERDGRQSPVGPLWGLWFLLPVIGHFVWYFKVQHALNDFWVSRGARRD